MPVLTDNIPMRDYGDSVYIGTELVKILRYKTFDRDLHIKWPVSITSPLANISRFVHVLEHCSGENAKILYNHMKRSEPKIKGFGIDCNCYVTDNR